MKVLLSRPSSRVIAVVTLMAGLVTAGIRTRFAPLEEIMTRQGGVGIVPYEFAFTADRAQDILVGWAPEGRDAARRSLLIDYGFVPAYALLFGGITLLIARAQMGRLQRIGLALALGCVVAALFDGLENLMLLRMLSAPSVAALPPLVAGVSASIKFLLLALAILYALAAGLAWVVRRLRGGRGNAR